MTFYNPLQTYSAEWVVHVINWARVHLDPSSAPNYGIQPGLVIDFDTMFLGAQSSGSHVAVNYLVLQQQNQVTRVPGHIAMTMCISRTAVTFTGCSCCPLLTELTLTA